MKCDTNQNQFTLVAPGESHEPRLSTKDSPGYNTHRTEIQIRFTLSKLAELTL